MHIYLLNKIESMNFLSSWERAEKHRRIISQYLTQSIILQFFAWANPLQTTNFKKKSSFFIQNKCKLQITNTSISILKKYTFKLKSNKIEFFTALPEAN